MANASDGEAADWRRKRADAVAEQAARLRQEQDAETAQAEALIADFVRRAAARGVRPEPLLARGRSGRGRYRTGLEGWYLRQDHSVAVGADGGFYVLTAPDSLLARVRGVNLAPSDPPLVLGRGGRDGQSVPLAELLDRRLSGG